jgi:hypothetical protein
MIPGFSFGATNPLMNSGNGQKYGYDRATGKWGWGVKDAKGAFTIAPTAAEAAAKKSALAKSQMAVGDYTNATPYDVVNDILTKGTAAIPAGLKDIGKSSTNTMTSTQAVAAPVQAAADKSADYVGDLIGNAGGLAKDALTSTSGQASQDFISNLMKGGGAGSAAMQGALAPTDTGFMDEGKAALKAKTLADTDMSKYMNPAEGALQASILRGGDIQKNAIRARQAKAGAFGGNSAVAQGQADENTLRQLGLASRDAYELASRNAMTDVAALNATDVGNRAAVQGVNAQKLGANLTDAQRALTGGAAVNQGQQSVANDAWQQYLQKIGMATGIGQGAASALGALPGSKTISTETLGPNEQAAGLGTLIGLTGLKQEYDPNAPKTGGGGTVSSSSKGTIPGARPF